MKKSIRTLLMAIFIAITPPSAQADYVMTQGKGWRLCEALHKELKRSAPEQLDHCPVHMLRSLPGVTEPDWQE